MYYCLVVQKDTIENNKVKSIIRNVTSGASEFVKTLQDGHCIEYQLIAYISSEEIDMEEFHSKLFPIITPFKTNYGKDWYEFDGPALASII